MATSVQPPPLMTDPLNMSPSAQRIDADQVEQDEIERQQAAMERGMPARNLKKVAILVLAVIAAGYMLWPTLFPKKKEEPAMVEAKTDRSLAGSIVDQLKSQPPTAKIPTVVPPVIQAPGPSQGLAPAEAGDKPLTSAETEMSRRDAIVASTMEPIDVAITGRQPRVAAVSDPNDPQAQLAKALSAQAAILEKTIGASSDGQGGERGPANGQPRRSPEDEFVMRSRNSVLEEAIRLAPARSRASLYQGTILQLVLDRAVDTENPGTARGRVRSDVFDSVNQDTLLIPRGSIVIMPYLNSTLVGQSRILLAGERLILPNGKSVSLSGGVASDMQGASGIPAEINNHFFEMFKASAVVGAVSLLLPKDQQQITVSSPASGGTQTGGSIIGSALYDIAKKINERNTTIKPTASLEVGEPFTLMLSRDMELEPYQGRK